MMLSNLLFSLVAAALLDLRTFAATDSECYCVYEVTEYGDTLDASELPYCLDAITNLTAQH